mgnify:FL=1
MDENFNVFDENKNQNEIKTPESENSQNVSEQARENEQTGYDESQKTSYSYGGGTRSYTSNPDYAA